MARFVPDTRKSMQNDAGENQTDVLQRASTIHDLDCDRLGTFAISFSVCSGKFLTQVPHCLIVYNAYGIEFFVYLYCPKIPAFTLLKGEKLQSR